MDRLLYIADGSLNEKNGHGLQKKMHNEMLTSIFGENMWCCLFDSNDTPINGRYLVAGRNTTLKKILAVICGYAPCIDIFLIRRIVQVIRKEKINTIFVESSVYGKLLGRIRKEFPDIYIIAYFANIEKQSMRDEIKYARLVRKVSLLIMIRNEAKTVRYSNRQLVLNNRDEKLFEKFYKVVPTDIIPSIYKMVNHNGSNEKHNSGDPLKILFVGVDYGPNVRGVQWFIDKVCQRINNDYTLTIVGRGIEKYKDRWEKSNQNINVIGTVDDLSLYYYDSDVVISPIFEGGGIKIKTGEALSYGKMLIGTDEGLEGYWENAGELKDKYIFLCNTPDEFACVINKLTYREFYKVNSEVCEFINREYSYESNLKKMRNIIFNRK